MHKIAVADNQNLKFDGDLVDHWREVGHEVKYEMGASEHLFQWCDIYYVNFWDNNIHYLWNWWNKNTKVKKPKIVCRALDYEVWLGLVRSQEMVDWVDVGICIAPHIERQLRKDAKWGNKLHLIRPGVKMSKFPFKEKFGSHNILLPCNEIDWVLKNVVEGIKIFGMLCRQSDNPWHLTVKGKWTGQAGGDYFRYVLSDLEKKMGVEGRITYEEQHIEQYNEFLNNFDYILQPSLKEAFSYVTAECMAKGMKPVINSWYGAEEIWTEGFLYTTPDEAVKLLLEKPYPKHYRTFIRKNYDAERMFAEYDRAIWNEK